LHLKNSFGKYCIVIELINKLSEKTMVWQPGQSGNPKGRPRKYPEVPPGADPRYYYKQTAIIKEELQYSIEHPDGAVLEDPVLFQHKQMMNESLPIGLRLAVATAIAPYCHPKLGLVSPPRFIETPIEVPDFKSIAEAETFLARLAQRFASAELGSQSALDLSTLVRNWISAKHSAMELEIKHLNADAAPDEQVIRIEGGLPALPGTDIIMPKLNSPPAIDASQDHAYCHPDPLICRVTSSLASDAEKCYSDAFIA
jgi:hypothetical protein